MKKVLLQIGMITLLLSLTACSEAASLDSTNTTQGTTEASSTMVIVVTDESDASTVITENVTEQEKANTDESSDPAPKNTDTATVETSTSTETQTADSSAETERQEVNTSVSTDNMTDNTTNTNISTEDTSDETPSVESQPASPYDVIAKEGTEELLAERIVYYINQYRMEEGNVIAEVLPGLTELCKQRSRQLVDNYAHDRQASIALATAAQYGYYVNPRDSGIDIDPYYNPQAQEAINRCTAICVYTVDQMAKRAVDSFRASKGHWNYVGAADLSYKDRRYVGVGATFENGTWYICVWVSKTNKYEKSQ